MSSVGSADNSQRNSDNDAVRRTREEARDKESELVKKQAREVRRINEQHYAEVERLKQDHTAQMADLHKDSREEISVRDHKYQQDIEDIRALHRKDAQRNADENQRKEDATKAVNTNDSTQQKKYTDQRMSRLGQDYRDQLEKISKHYDEAIEVSHSSQAEAIDKNRTKQQKQNELEKNTLRTERNEVVGDLNNQYSNYRNFVNQEREETQVRHMQQNKRASENLMHAVAKERATSEDGKEVLREGFKASLQDTRDRYDKARKIERQALDSSQNDLKTLAVDRIDNEVTRLQHENRDLKEVGVQDQLKAEHATRQEVQNIRDAFTKNIENYKDQRDEILHQANSNSAKDIEKVRKDLSGQAVENSRFYRGKMEVQNRIFRSSYDNLKGDFAARNEQTKTTTDDRIKHIVDNTNEDKTRLIELSEQSHANSQLIKQDELKNLRDAMTDDKEATVGRMQDQMRKQEVQHTERMAQVVGKYEKTITSLKDQMLRDKKNGEDNTKRLTEELARVHKMEVDQVESKNREKVRVLGSQHSEELRTLNKRHEEKLDQVIGEMKKS